MFGMTVMFNNVNDAIIWRDINESRQYADTFFEDNKSTILSYAQWHEKYVQAAKILKYEALDKMIDQFIVDYNSHKNYKSYTYYPISSKTKEGPFEASKLNNLYYSILLNQELSAKEKSTLVNKVVTKTKYGYLEYLTEVFKSATYEVLSFYIQTLTCVAKDKYATERQLPTKNDNLYLSIFTNPNLSEIERANLITIFHLQYDHLYLFDRSIMGKMKDKKNFRLLLIESYIASCSKRIFDDNRSSGVGRMEIPLVNLLDPADEKEIWNFIFEEEKRVLPILKLLLEEVYAHQDSKMCYQRFCIAYIDTKKSFTDVKNAVTSLCEQIASMRHKSHLSLPDESLREEIKKAANKKILALRGAQAIDSKDEKDEVVRDYLGKDINDKPPTCCFFWQGSTKDQDVFDKIKVMDYKLAGAKK
jgi:hypothetical protein